ncbi:MAG: YraN family protein [Eggerthellaceae bacterium]|nr:YraN family protein [Eggerthellaceae bacterium]
MTSKATITAETTREMESATTESREDAKILDQRGKEAAAKFLERRGYDVIERNWSCYAGTVDIIANDEDTLVFVEVNTCRDDKGGFPAETNVAEKRAQYEKIALAFLTDYDAVDMTVRFDNISIVVIGDDRALVRHHIGIHSTC